MKVSSDIVSSGRVANFTSEFGTCKGIVELFKNLLHATTHYQFLALELQALARNSTVIVMV